MVTPNLSIKLTIIYALFFGFITLIKLKGINKILGVFLIYYAYINLLSLRNKGKKLFKLALLKVNIAILTLILAILNYRAITNINNEFELYIILLILIPIIINWLAIRNYKL